ncbi:hypothetical protein ABPG77_001096 [Micractinium sp. CCAP 211/92]
MALSAKQLERGKALWEDARRCTEGKGELGALRTWAEQCRCAEADRLLAKALLHVAVNRMISWATENLRKLHSLSQEARMQMEVTLEFEVVGLFNEALEVAARSAHKHNSLQCFYLGCLIAHAVRGRANCVHMVHRVRDLHRLDEKRKEWREAGAPGSAPWASPGAERIIGERAPFETDSRHAASWAARALQLGGQRLDEALRDEQACMDLWSTTGRQPEPRSSDPHAVVFDVAASLPMRLTLLHELVPEERRRQWSGLLATGTMRISGGAGTVKHDLQHKMSQQAAQSLKLQQTQLKLREQRERRMLEAAATTAAGGGVGSGGSGGSSTLAALEKPSQEDLRRYLERRLQDAAAATAAAAADASSSGKAKARPRKPAPGLQLPGRPATSQVAALQSLARVPLGELATTAVRLGEQGALPQQVVKRVQDLVGRLAARGGDSPCGTAGGSPRASPRSGYVFRFPPAEGPAAPAPAPRGRHGQQAKQGDVLCELPTPEALTAYLQASYLGEAEAARVAAEPAIEALLDRLPGVRRLLESLPRQKHGLQLLQGDDVLEPPSPLPHPGALTFEGNLAHDVAFVRLALRGPNQGSIPSAEELLAAVKFCAPPLNARAAGPSANDNATAGRGGGGSEMFLGSGDEHLRQHFTSLDYYAHKCTALWLPVADSAIDTSRILPHSSDASFPRHVTAREQKVHPGKPSAEAALSRMLLGATMLHALQTRREGGGGGPQEAEVNAALQRPWLDRPEALLSLLEMETSAALALQAAAADIVRAAAEAGAAGTPAAAGSDSLLSSAAGGASGGTMEPPPVQVAAAALLASVLAQQPQGARFKMDQLNAERKQLAASVLAGVQQLLRRRRLTLLAARALCEFVRRALLEAGARAPLPELHSLPACLGRLGSLPLVALAQLAAFVCQLIGRSFLDLADLDPEAFQDLSGGQDLPAELVGCDLQLTERGLAGLLGVASLTELGPAGAAPQPSRASNGPDAALSQRLLPQAAQRIAAYVAPGSSGEREREQHAALAQQRGGPSTGGGRCSWSEVLSALQQQAFLTDVLLDLRRWLDATSALALTATTALDSFRREATAGNGARGQGGGLAAAPPTELRRLLAEVAGVLPQSMLALALAGHAWASLEHHMLGCLARQCEEGDDAIGRRLQARHPSRPDELQAETARAQLRVFRGLKLNVMADLERKLQLTQHLAERGGVAFVQERISPVLAPLSEYLRQQEAAQGGGCPGPTAQQAEQAGIALLRMIDKVNAELNDVAGMQGQLTGLLDCLHLRTQLLLSELHARCCVHPPSELMGLALREVLPLQWQLEWRRMQENNSEALMAELLAEEEEQQQQEKKKAAKKKAQKKEASSEAASANAASARGDPEAEAGASRDEEALAQRPSMAASGAPRADDSPAGGGHSLPESWEGLPQAAGKVAAAAEQGAPLPAGYVRMLQHLEDEEREQLRQRQLDEDSAAVAAAEAVVAAAAADLAADQAAMGKKKRRNKKKKGAGGSDAADASPDAAAAAGEGEGGEWQAVAKTGARRPQQAQQQAQQQPAQQSSGARVLTVRRDAVQPAPPTPPSLSEPATPPPGLRAQPQAKEPPQQAQQQQQAWQEEQAPNWQPVPAAAGDEWTQHPGQREQQGQAAQGGLWQEAQHQLHPGFPGNGSGLPGDLPSLPNGLEGDPVQPPSAGAQPSSMALGGLLGPQEHSIPPEQHSHNSGSLFSQPLLEGPPPAHVQPPPQARHSLSGGLSLAADQQLPRSLSPLPSGQPWPAGPTAQQPWGSPLSGSVGAAAREDDFMYLQWLGVREGQATPGRPAGPVLAGAAAAGSPPYEAGQPQGLLPPQQGQQLDGLQALLQTQLPGGSHVAMQQQPAGFSGGLQPAGGLADVGGSLFSAPLPPQSPPLPLPENSLFSAPLAVHSPVRPQPMGFAAAADLPAAALLQQPEAPEPQPFGLGGGFAIAKPALDPETVAAAAAAAQLAGYAREPAQLPAAHLPQQHAQQAQQQALFAQQQLSSGRAPVDWGALQAVPAQQEQPGLAQPPQHDAELDSLYQMLGVSDGGQVPAAAETWSNEAAQLHPSHTQPRASNGAGLQVQAPAVPLDLGGGAPGHATAAQQQAGGETDSAFGLAGLRNETGEYNCFLNVIVQCLWRCADFRQQVLAWDVRAIGHNGVARALHRLFRSLQLAAASGSGAPVAVDPSQLREALAALPNQLFRLGEMSDAGETLLSMFEQIQDASHGSRATLDRLFGLRVAESAKCSHCGAVTHKNAYTQFFYNTRASALRRVVAQVAEGRRRGIIGPKALGARLRAAEEQVHKSCDTDHGGCNRSVPVVTWLEAAPRVFSLQIAWQSNTESPQDIAATLAAVDERLDLSEVYRVDVRAGTHRYRLRSMVCYYGQHYQALVLVPEAGGWLVFDDTRVALVGGWAEVLRKCEAGRIQPSVLFYEAEGAA